MVSEALIIHMLSTWSGYGVFGTGLLLLQKVAGAMVSMVSDGLDLGGRGSGFYGNGSFGPGRSGLRCLWCLGQCGRAMVSMVSDGLDLGGRGYGVSGVWGRSGCGVYGVCWS